MQQMLKLVQVVVTTSYAESVREKKKVNLKLMFYLKNKLSNEQYFVYLIISYLFIFITS